MPIIINIDSQYDWTEEVQHLWEHIAWDDILSNIFPFPDGSLRAVGRKDQLVLIGLCSSLLINRAYGWDIGQDDDNENNQDRFAHEDWMERQKKERQNSNDCRDVRRFTGEETHFRSPKTGKKGVVECFGIYFENWATFLRGMVNNAVGKTNTALPEGPAIFLCPERIIEIYPTLMTLGEDFRNPLPLSSNPTLVNLKMVLFHELGHHFFPVHRAGIERYVSEGLANYFCLLGIEDSEKLWLLYKTWHLQPPEYSAYRLLELFKKKVVSAVGTNASQYAKRIAELKGKKEIESYEQNDLERLLGLSEALFKLKRDQTCLDRSLNEAFSGSIDGWEGIFYSPEWHDAKKRMSENTTMAMTMDYVPIAGFTRDLTEYYGLESWRWENGLDNHHYRISRHDSWIPADLLWDLYEGNSILPWVFVPKIPERFWGSWGMSTNAGEMGMDSSPAKGRLSWPEGPLYRSTKKEDWLKIVKESPYAWAREATMVWLLRQGDKAQVLDVLKNIGEDSFNLKESMWYFREPVIDAAVTHCLDALSRILQSFNGETEKRLYQFGIDSEIVEACLIVLGKVNEKIDMAVYSMRIPEVTIAVDNVQRKLQECFFPDKEKGA